MPKSPAVPRPLLLCILDGWGHSEAVENNAIALARTPNWDRLTATAPRALLNTSAGDVGSLAGLSSAVTASCIDWRNAGTWLWSARVFGLDSQAIVSSVASSTTLF